MSLIEREKTGMEILYDKYADMLYRLAYASLMSGPDAEDAVHDVFIKYMKKRPVFNDAEHEKAWLIRVTVNRCRDMGRRKKIREYTPLEDAEDTEDGDTGGQPVLRSVMELPEKYKTAILLHYFEENGVETVAAMLGISVSAVKMRLLRGREMLKKALGKEGIYV